VVDHEKLTEDGRLRSVCAVIASVRYLVLVVIGVNTQSRPRECSFATTYSIQTRERISSGEHSTRVGERLTRRKSTRFRSK
jgi:hypothetical protein